MYGGPVVSCYELNFNYLITNYAINIDITVSL